MPKLNINDILINLDVLAFIDYYSNHSTNSTILNFHLTEGKFNLLLDYCNLKKHDKGTNTKLTCLEKYGCINVFQTDTAKLKTRATKELLYGDPCYNNPDARRETCLEKYGTPSASGNIEIQTKIKATYLAHFGVDNIFQNTDYMNLKYVEKYGTLKNFYNFRTINIKSSIESKYNVDNVSQLIDWADKVNSTSLKNNGCLWPCQSDACKLAYRLHSKLNTSFELYLLNYNINIDLPEFALGNYLYDFKINNNLLELNPYITHNSTYSPWNKPKNSDYHFNKSKLARENGYRCIHIWDWDNIDKIISLLLPRESVYARKCEIKEVDFLTATSFINTYHLQGDTRKNNNDIRIGLYYEDNLVSIMTFGKPRYNKNYDYELLRYCSSKKVIGGAERLFKYFINVYKPESIISYCDLSKFNGNTYIKLGFKEKSISIGKHWYNPKTNEHITDNLLRLRGFDLLFKTNYGKGTNNNELMLNARFVEIYDAGQATYVYNKNDLD